MCGPGRLAMQSHAGGGLTGTQTEAWPQVPNIGALWRTETTSRWEGRK